MCVELVNERLQSIRHKEIFKISELNNIKDLTIGYSVNFLKITSLI